jgi:hypothetical protein
MGLTLYQKLEGHELRQFIETTTNAHWVNETLVLQPKFGSTVLNFTGHGVISCVLNFKRISGNGIVLISSNGKSKEYQINSKSSQSISVNIGGDGKLTIHRTNRSRGDLSLLDVSLYKDVNTKTDWNKIINKCDGHACLRLIGNNLYASDGAWLRGQNIKVQTNPPGMFVKTGDTIKFLGSCRVVELEVSGDPQPEKPPIKPLNLPIKKEEKVEAQPKPDSIKKEPKPAPDLAEPEQLSNVVYDTKTSGFAHGYCNSFAKATSSGVMLDHRGGYNIPLRDLKPNKTYVITVQVARISGNGKFIFGILPDNGTSTTRVAAGGTQAFTTEIRPIVGGDSYSLSVWRHPSAKGQIQLSRIIVLSETSAAPLEAREINHIQLPITAEKVERPKVALESPILNANNKPLICTDLGNAIRQRALEFSRAVPQKYKPSTPLSIKSTIKTNTLSGMRWLSMVHPFIPDVQPHDDPHASISRIDNLIRAKKMYIEEFTGTVPDSAIDVLNLADEVFVASNLNAEVVRHKAGIQNLRVTSKRLPYITPKPLNLIGQDYVLISNDDPQVTEYMLNALEPIGAKIVLLGARGQVPKNVFPVNEYTPYDQLLHIFGNAKTFVDIPLVEDQLSNFVDLALASGVQVVSSSWAYMELPHVLFVTGTEKVGSRMVPEVEDLREALRDARKTSDANFDEFSKNFVSFATELLG